MQKAHQSWLPLPQKCRISKAEAYASAVFPTLDEQGKAKEAVTKNWDAVVGANVK